jgi:hypothetical protein
MRTTRRGPRLRTSSGICWGLLGMLDDLEPYRIRPCPRNCVGSGNRPLMRPAIGHPHDESFSERLFSRAVWRHFWGNDFSFWVERQCVWSPSHTDGRIGHHPFHFMRPCFLRRRQARCSLDGSDCVPIRGQIRGDRGLGFLPVRRVRRALGRGCQPLPRRWSRRVHR